jgi:hypothetical protein
LAVKVTDSLLVTAGAVNVTFDPVVLSSDPPTIDHVIVPPKTSVLPDFTTAENVNVDPDSAVGADGEIPSVVARGSLEGRMI